MKIISSKEEALKSTKADWRPVYPALVYTRAVGKGSQQDTASPLTPWIYGILDFCNVRIKDSLSWRSMRNLP
jgi:hypothetical protein